MDLHAGPQGHSGEGLEREKSALFVCVVCALLCICAHGITSVACRQTRTSTSRACAAPRRCAVLCFACGAMHILPWFVSHGSCVVQLRGARACGARARTVGVQHAIVVVCLWCVCTDTSSRVGIEACRCSSAEARRTTPPTLRVTHTQRGGRCPFAPRHEPFHLPEKLRGTRSVTSPATDNQLVPMKFKNPLQCGRREGRITTSMFVHGYSTNPVTSSQFSKANLEETQLDSRKGPRITNTVWMSERVVYRHGAILLILRVCCGFNARRSRHHGS